MVKPTRARLLCATAAGWFATLISPSAFAEAPPLVLVDLQDEAREEPLRSTILRALAGASNAAPIEPEAVQVADTANWLNKLEAARRWYRQFEFEKAALAYADAEKAIAAQPPAADSVALLRQARLQRARIAIELRRIDEARQAIAAQVTLEPDRPPSTEEGPPEVLQIWNEERARARRIPACRIDVHPTPADAWVEVDGGPPGGFRVPGKHAVGGRDGVGWRGAWVQCAPTSAVDVYVVSAARAANYRQWPALRVSVRRDAAKWHLSLAQDGSTRERTEEFTTPPTPPALENLFRKFLGWSKDPPDPEYNWELWGGYRLESVPGQGVIAQGGGGGGRILFGRFALLLDAGYSYAQGEGDPPVHWHLVHANSGLGFTWWLGRFTVRPSLVVGYLAIVSTRSNELPAGDLNGLQFGGELSGIVGVIGPLFAEVAFDGGAALVTAGGVQDVAGRWGLSLRVGVRR